MGRRGARGRTGARGGGSSPGPAAVGQVAGPGAAGAAAFSGGRAPLLPRQVRTACRNAAGLTHQRLLPTCRRPIKRSLPSLPPALGTVRLSARPPPSRRAEPTAGRAEVGRRSLRPRRRGGTGAGREGSRGSPGPTGLRTHSGTWEREGSAYSRLGRVQGSGLEGPAGRPAAFVSQFFPFSRWLPLPMLPRGGARPARVCSGGSRAEEWGSCRDRSAIRRLTRGRQQQRGPSVGGCAGEVGRNQQASWAGLGWAWPLRGCQEVGEQTHSRGQGRPRGPGQGLLCVVHSPAAVWGVPDSPLFFTSSSFLRFYLSLVGEGREREREENILLREKHRLVASCTDPWLP